MLHIIRWMPWMLQHRRLVGSPHVPATAPPPPISGWDLRLKVVRSLDRPACRRIYLTWKAYAPEWREADRSVVRRFGGLVVWWFGGAAVEQWLRRWCGIVRCWAVFFVFTSSFFFWARHRGCPRLGSETLQPDLATPPFCPLLEWWLVQQLYLWAVWVA